MAIDVINKRPVFDNITAGLSGSAIKPIALRMIWELYDTLKESNMPVPIIGIGGISCANDALEFLMAGASAIQVGSATLVNPHSMPDIIEGIFRYMKNNDIFEIGKISIRNEK
jgi:dihydroorotate dehydrogenase (NAD+) catalytic subunit